MKTSKIPRRKKAAAERRRYKKLRPLNPRMGRTTSPDIAITYPQAILDIVAKRQQKRAMATPETKEV